MLSGTITMFTVDWGFPYDPAASNVTTESEPIEIVVRRSNRVASIAAHAGMVDRARFARPKIRPTRHGFAQFAPLPCYRAVRTR